MEIHYASSFRKNFNKRIRKDSHAEKRYKERLALFIKNRQVSVLRDHRLIGKRKSYRAFSITGDIRVVYIEESKDIITFVDIGTHNQVYK